ncbi:MAG: tRNA uridine-5-carboxymethylaminomethyl(34) synthesis GTPase MnmE [Saprospirales bacterium]|nr:MAG: tRNA uridine-5-carboxymethylaminomethyl(34) synthesis GTPase MnmE [Saprospirales bacterium]
MVNKDTIVARSTPPGKSAIAVIRISGPDALNIVAKRCRKQQLVELESRELLFTRLWDEVDELLDEVVLACFPGPASYTGENVVEISCHGSEFIVQQITEQLVRDGARPAGPGEFTMRAFFNGKLDLAQAEAVIDLIDSETKSQHQLAVDQMRGGFSKKIEALREKLVHFASMIELELDFGEEDVEFADRKELGSLVEEINAYIDRLLDSFSMGNAIKKGVCTVIAGRPNAGKSTLLNALLEEDRAIVSDIEGTTRDTIEEIIYLEGVPFRLIDTAGIREAGDTIEEIGIEKTMAKIAGSAILIYVFDVKNTGPEEVLSDIEKVSGPNTQVIAVANKRDLVDEQLIKKSEQKISQRAFFVTLSAIDQTGLDVLKGVLLKQFKQMSKGTTDTVLHNTRHYRSLLKTREALEAVLEGLENNMPADLIAMDIRHAMNYLGEILGKGITSEDLLGNIFSRFCIGK